MNLSIDELLDFASSAGYTVEVMDDDELSAPDSPAVEDSILGTHEQSALDKQRASLQSYLDVVPYQCESLDFMQGKLEEIVSKICLCVETKNWLILTTWDGILQWYAQPFHDRKFITLAQFRQVGS